MALAIAAFAQQLKTFVALLAFNKVARILY